MQSAPGLIALFGSGETSLAGGRVFESLAQGLPRSLRIAILETPAGFELNSAQVAGRVADFLRARLQNYTPVVEVVPARKRCTAFSPDDISILTPLLRANLIFMGPGSPTYAVRQLRGSLAWDLLRARHRLGATLVFASAATIAIGTRALPVYEIYKVGEDVTAPPGLDLFADFGLSLSCISHWNNAEGGADLDTSRCFIGRERFEAWTKLLPPEQTIVGLDEHTALMMDFAAGKCCVDGVGGLTVRRSSEEHVFPGDMTFPMTELGAFHLPESLEEGIPAQAWEMAKNAPPPESENEEIPAEVQQLVEERQQARACQDWAAADELRRRIAALGWQVQDTPQGSKLMREDKTQESSF